MSERRVAPLTAEQQQRVRATLPLCTRLARRFAPRCRFLSFDELVSIGHEALVDAARTFDPSHGVPFEAFAYIRIRGEMSDRAAREHREQTLPLAAARRAEARHLAAPLPEGDPFAETRDDAKKRAADWAQGLADTMILAALLAERPTGESELCARQEYARGVAALSEALRVLDPREAELVELLYTQGLSMRQSASQLGVALRTVQRHHEKIVERLGSELRRRGVDAPPPVEGDAALEAQRGS